MARQKPFEKGRTVSAYLKAKMYREAKLTLRGYLKDSFLIFLGICSATFGLKGFLLTNKFIDGGVTGISLLVSAIADVPVYLLIIVLNIPFIIMGYRTLGIQFAIKTAIGITGLSLFIANVSFPNITDDNLLVAVFGGTFLGAGIGFAIRGGAVIDGTEVLAIYLSKKIGATVGDVIIIINVLIFSTAAYFLTVEIALFSMITYFAASRTLDFIIEGIEEYVGVTIISSHSEEIKNMIINKLGRGVTVYQGKSGYGRRGEKKDLEIVYTVVTRLELNKLNSEIEKIEPDVFMVMTPVKDTRGGMIKQRPLKH
ncbi:MAG TPA: YitT family protein [Chitinophagaceae bacterium]|mgnify:CR=1 FL=1|nr:YitT family protein [Chitinophagaceae bacterium]